MKIAIQASDLDHSRIDGTRVYILNLLKNFGKLDLEDEFLIYHKNHFNPELTPPIFPNYKIIQKSFPFHWTQIRFALEIWKNKPDVLWMPMQALPFFRRKNLKTVVTIHDLAFKIFPEYFPYKDLRRLNLLTDYAIKSATKIIAVSESTKKDILKFFPEVKAEKIKVIYHGFDKEVFEKKYSEEEIKKITKNYQLKNKNYLLYVGAIQPRKNLETLISAFEIFKKETGSPMKLALIGEKAWLWEKVFEKAEKSHYKSDIIIPGKLKFGDLGAVMQGARVFVFPSFYEGFGIPILEAFASKVPVISANNSSLPEVGKDAVIYFASQDLKDLVQKIKLVLDDKNLQEKLIAKGLEITKNFSWKKCTKETLEYLKS